MTRAVFLDRDGVVNRDRGYVHRWEDFEFVPGALHAARRLADAGFRLIVVTNQSGIARGYYTEAQYHALTERMRDVFELHGAPLSAVYHCPHHPAGSVTAFARECDCRKPKPGMILRAVAEHALSLPESILVGDKLSDIEAARAAGVGRAYLVCSDKEGSVSDNRAADAAYADLAQCVDALLHT
jgi:D-glycero-D-manno-heptose 1,7-bisphosphate phosphatase